MKVSFNYINGATLQEPKTHRRERGVDRRVRRALCNGLDVKCRSGRGNIVGQYRDVRALTGVDVDGVGVNHRDADDRVGSPRGVGSRPGGRIRRGKVRWNIGRHPCCLACLAAS